MRSPFEGACIVGVQKYVHLYIGGYLGALAVSKYVHLYIGVYFG